MLISFDENHLLTIDNPELTQLKTYQYMMSGWRFSSLDKEIFVYHKRIWKKINLKNLGDGMQVAYLQERKNIADKLDFKMIEASLAMFQAFDEEQGTKYCFLPSFSKDISSIQKKCNEKFLIDCLIEKKQWWTFVYGLKEAFYPPETEQELLSFLFMMVLLYGKFDEKKGELVAIKAHIPMFWVHNNLETWLAEQLAALSHKWIFISLIVVRNWESATFQFSSNDIQLLEVFSQRWNTYRLDQEVQLSLQSFLSKQTEIRNQLFHLISSEYAHYQGSQEVLDQLQTWTLKLLK